MYVNYFKIKIMINDRVINAILNYINDIHWKKNPKIWTF